MRLHNFLGVAAGLNLIPREKMAVPISVRNEFGGARGLGGRGVKTSHRPTDFEFEPV